MPNTANWKLQKSVDIAKTFGALMTNLLKAYDYLSYKLLIANLIAYGFDKKSLKLVYSFLPNRKQKVKTNDSDSSWGNFIFSSSKFNTGPLPFNIFICDMFYFLGDHGIANYANDSIPYNAKTNHKLELQKASSILFKWFQANYMEINTDKSSKIKLHS